MVELRQYLNSRQAFEFAQNLKLRISLVLVMCVCSCALNNQIVINNSIGNQNKFLAKGFEFNFPQESDIHFVKLHGAAWVLSGDISEIAQAVVSKIGSQESLLLPNNPGSQLNIREISINYTDGRWGGSVADPGIRLSMQFDGLYDGEVIESCDEVEVIPNHQPPVEHGLFATRDQIREMIQPVFEKLIADALDEAIFLSLICLSQEAISQKQE